MGDEHVTPVGNSWIMRRSKSHSGRVYYFNTLTGEATWNLSEPQIEKAKQIIAGIGSKSAVQSFAIPKEPPLDHTCQGVLTCVHSSQSAVICNKRIMNDQCHKCICSCHSQFAAAQCSVCGPLTTATLSVPQHNRNIHTVPTSHHVCIASNVTPIVNQSQTASSFNYNSVENNISIQSTSVPLSNHFNAVNDQKCKYPSLINQNRINQLSPRIPINRFERKLKFQQKPFNDLRQLLSAKKNLNNFRTSSTKDVRDSGQIKINKQFLEESQDRSTNCNQVGRDCEGESYNSDPDEEWLEENMHVIGTKLKLDITCLRNLTKSDTNTDIWYIVVDTSILLNNLNLLYNIVNSDEQCRLTVPQFIETEIAAAANDDDIRLKNRARRARTFLAQYRDAGLAFIGENTTQFKDGPRILDYCLQLTLQNYHIILLSDNKELQKHKYTTQIPTFTIKEVKKLIATSSTKKYDSTKRVPHPFERLIQITVPNDINHFESLGKNNFSNTDNGTLCNINIEASKEQHPAKKEVGIQIDSGITSLKEIIDTGVQTDLPVTKVTSNCNDNVNQIVEKNEASRNCNNFKTSSENVDEGTTRADRTSKYPRLNRTLSNQISKNNNDENVIMKKQFKWRRRRNNPSSQFVELKSSCNLNNTDVQNNEIDIREDSCYKSGETSGSEKQFLCNTTERLEYENKYRYNNDDGSESSSNIHRYTTDNIIIEETSTSGVISNTSNVDTESVNSNINRNRLMPKSNHQEDKKIENVMFEVRGKIMEERLMMRRDEWVSRFIQIMEEVLTQVLQQNPPFIDKLMPPPWTIHEASECIKKKFSFDHEVQDAANKLSRALYNVSDKQGKISMNITPSEYMQMYSYGVYLVDTLQSLQNNCEDLQTAAESLSKLLSDIQEPVSDSSHLFSDSFVECNLAELSNNTTEINDESKTEKNTNRITEAEQKLSEWKEQEALDSAADKIAQHNLSFKKCKHAENNRIENKSIESIENIGPEYNNFHNRELHNNETFSNKDECGKQNHVANTEKISNSQNMGEFGTTDNRRIDTENKESIDDNRKKNTEPKFIRNFTKCLEFEERIKNKLMKPLVTDESDYSESEQEEYEYMEEDYFIDNRFYNDVEYGNDKQMSTEQQNSESTRDESNKNDVDTNNNFKRFCGNFFYEIKNTFLKIRTFCEKCHEVLNNPEQFNLRKIDIHDKAEKVHLQMDNLCKCLNEIILRGTKRPEENIEALSMKFGLNVAFTGIQSVEYRDIVSKCINQAEVLLESLSLIIYVTKSR